MRSRCVITAKFKSSSRPANAICLLHYEFSHFLPEKNLWDFKQPSFNIIAVRNHNYEYLVTVKVN